MVCSAHIEAGTVHLFVSSVNNDRILRYDGRTGAFQTIFVTAGSGGLIFPIGLQFGPDQNLYVVNRGSPHSVRRFNSATGAFMDVFASGGGLGSPLSLDFGPDGHLYFGSQSTNEVLRYKTAPPPGSKTAVRFTTPSEIPR